MKSSNGYTSNFTINIVLAKAIAESFYNSMRNQQQSGGQLNETLELRAKVIWCLLPLRYCSLYLCGDGVIQPYMKSSFLSGRAKESFISKVFDQIDTNLDAALFLSTNTVTLTCSFLWRNQIVDIDRGLLAKIISFRGEHLVYSLFERHIGILLPKKVPK